MNRTNPDKNLKESAIHRSGKIPLKIYADDYVPYHWHEEYEILYLEEGQAQCTINGVQICLKKGKALLIQSKDLHAYSSSNGTQNMHAIVVHPDFWASEDNDGIFSGNIRFQQEFSMERKEDRFFFDTVQQIRSCYAQKQFGYEFRLKALLAGLFATMLENDRYSMAEDHTAPSETDTARNLFSYVHEHYAEELSLEQLAKLSHYSKSYIIKLFKKNTGQTPIEYINRYRLDRAKSLLKNKKNSILDVSLMSGFQNVGYFIRIFKSHFGMTPGVYRKELLQKVSES